MTRPHLPIALATLATLLGSSGCRSSNIQAGRDSLGIIVLIIIGGALFVALFGYLYGQKSPK